MHKAVSITLGSEISPPFCYAINSRRLVYNERLHVVTLGRNFSPLNRSRDPWDFRAAPKTFAGGVSSTPAFEISARDADATTGAVAEDRLLSTTGAVPTPALVFGELNFGDQHLLLLGFIACATTGAISCLLLAAIPTLLALKKAAESLGKLADTAREELPGTMAAVRLSGMEISDLTMELSELGQEISDGVRSSARAVRAAEDGLRRMGSFASVAMLQERASGQVEVVMPAVARAARSTRETLVHARSLLHSLITLSRISSWLAKGWRFFIPRHKSVTSQP